MDLLRRRVNALESIAADLSVVRTEFSILRAGLVPQPTADNCNEIGNEENAQVEQ